MPSDLRLCPLRARVGFVDEPPTKPQLQEWFPTVVERILGPQPQPSAAVQAGARDCRTGIWLGQGLAKPLPRLAAQELLATSQ
jgi:hypothetical protein